MKVLLYPGTHPWQLIESASVEENCPHLWLLSDGNYLLGGQIAGDDTHIGGIDQCWWHIAVCQCRDVLIVGNHLLPRCGKPLEVAGDLGNLRRGGDRSQRIDKQTVQIA